MQGPDGKDVDSWAVVDDEDVTGGRDGLMAEVRLPCVSSGRWCFAFDGGILALPALELSYVHASYMLATGDPHSLCANSIRQRDNQVRGGQDHIYPAGSGWERQYRVTKNQTLTGTLATQ
jgi:hypothetical protein